MKTFLTKASLALALGATALTAAAPADAQRYNGGYRDHDGTGTAIIAGIAGLAIGAAIASSSHRRDGYYEQGYYQQGYYGQPEYYADRGYDRGYDRDRRYNDDRRHRHDRYDRGDDEGNGYGRGYQGYRGY